MVRENRVGLLSQLLSTGEIAAVADVDVVHQPVRRLPAEMPQPPKPGVGGRRGRRGGQPIQQGQVVLEGTAASQKGPRHGGSPQERCQGRPLLLQQGVDGGHGAHQGRQLQWISLTGSRAREKPMPSAW